MVDISLSQEELEDASQGLILGIRIAEGYADDARKRLCEHRAKSYDEYLQLFNRLEVADNLVADLRNLKKKGQMQ